MADNQFIKIMNLRHPRLKNQTDKLSFRDAHIHPVQRIITASSAQSSSGSQSFFVLARFLWTDAPPYILYNKVFPFPSGFGPP